MNFKPYSFKLTMTSVYTLTSEDFSADCRTILDRIYHHIASQPTDGHASLLGGQMGYALFEAYYHRHFGIKDDGRIWERVSSSLNDIQEGKLIHSFAGGIAGVAWGFLHLFNEGLLQDDEIDPQSIVEDLDEGLFESAMLLLADGNFDYLHGALGVCLYFLERTPSLKITSYIDQIVEQLSLVAVRFPSGSITWEFDDFGRRGASSPPLYNLGLSHGTASIVAILTLIYEKGYAPAPCQELIAGALRWMWNVRNKSAQSVFPSVIQANAPDQESRLAWCYGDLGIANTFLLVGQKLQNEFWVEIAEQTITRAAARRGRDVAMKDAALCHGTLGAAYLFGKFAKAFPQHLLGATETYWFSKTFDYVQPTESSDVFLSYNGERYESNLSLLDGEASIGMALLTYLGAPRAWERFLLLS